jgi:hypothetical protein
MAESKPIAEGKIAKSLAKIGVASDSKRRASDGRIFPMQYVPVVPRDCVRQSVPADQLATAAERFLVGAPLIAPFVFHTLAAAAVML